MTFTERLYTNLGSRIEANPPSWRQDAACRGMDPDMFFPTRGVTYDDLLEQVPCPSCPVRRECREAGEDEQWGIWGGKAIGYRRAHAEEPPELVECEGCGKTLPNQKGGRVRKWCSMNCRHRALREAS